MRNDSDVVIDILIGFILGIIICGMCIVLPAKEEINIIKQEAIDHKAAIYAPDTGEFTWRIPHTEE